MLSLEVFTDPESASALDASAPAAASDPAASAPARAPSAGCNTKVIPVGSYSHSSYKCAEKCSPACPSALCHCLSHLLTNSETPLVRHQRVWLHFCLPLSLQFMGITTKPESLKSSHAVGNNSEAINEMPKILYKNSVSFSSRSKLQTCFTHTQYLILDLDFPCKRLQVLLHTKEQQSLYSPLPRINVHRIFKYSPSPRNKRAW